MGNKCPRCGGEIKCLAGHSAHWRNWFCADEAGCGWQAWDQSAAPSPPQDPRDEDVQEIKRLQAAWNSAFNQAMENGAKYQQAMNVLRVAREAINALMEYLPRKRWVGGIENGHYVYEKGPKAILAIEKGEDAIHKIKELMGEK